MSIVLFVLIITVEMAHRFHNIGRARRANGRNVTCECWIYLAKLYVGAEKECQTVVWLLDPPAVRGSRILLSSSSASPTSPFPSSSLGIRKSSLSVGRPEAHLATSFLDSRSVGCSSTVRKERGLEKVGFPNHTLQWHKHYLDSSNFLSIGQS